MAKYINITSDNSGHVLSNKSSSPIRATAVLIANKSTSKNIIELKINDGSNAYTFVKTVLPGQTSITIPLPKYDPITFNLELGTDDDGGSTSMTVSIIGTAAFSTQQYLNNSKI